MGVNGRWIELTLIGLLALPFAMMPDSAEAATPQPTQTQASEVEVDVELRKGDSSASSSAVVEVGAETAIELDDARVVNMTIAQADSDASSLTVKLSLVRDGKTIVKKRAIEAAVGKTQTIKLGKGRVLALKVSPKPSHRIDLPDGDDPLSGVL